MAACKRAINNSRRLLFSNWRSLGVVNPEINYTFRYYSQLHVPPNNDKKRALLVDTLALVRSLEEHGVPQKQAEAITSAIKHGLLDSLDNMSQCFVSKADVQNKEVLHDANIARFKGEVQSSQDHHFALLQRETEKLQGDIEKMRSDLKNEIDKVTAGQRLDLNLERGRIRDEIANQKTETSNLTSKLDREINALRAHQEAGKVELIKYCIATLVSITAVGLAFLRSVK